MAVVPPMVPPARIRRPAPIPIRTPPRTDNSSPCCERMAGKNGSHQSINMEVQTIMKIVYISIFFPKHMVHKIMIGALHIRLTTPMGTPRRLCATTETPRTLPGTIFTGLIKIADNVYRIQPMLSIAASFHNPFIALSCKGNHGCLKRHIPRKRGYLHADAGGFMFAEKLFVCLINHAEIL